MENEALYLNEERLGDLEIDQRVSGEEDTEYIHMSRPYSSMYHFEYAVASLLADSHLENCLEEDPDWNDFDFEEMYR